VLDAGRRPWRHGRHRGMHAVVGLAPGGESGGVGDGVLQPHVPRSGAEYARTQQEYERDRGQRHRELGGDGARIAAESAPDHATVRARRTRSVRMPRTSSDRMITTRRPAKATAATVERFWHT